VVDGVPEAAGYAVSAWRAMTPADRKRLREMAEAATERISLSVGFSFPESFTPSESFYAAARTAIPALLDALDAAERERDEAIDLLIDLWNDARLDEDDEQSMDIAKDVRAFMRKRNEASKEPK
jgi:hypothetical protein